MNLAILVTMTHWAVTLPLEIFVQYYSILKI